LLIALAVCLKYTRSKLRARGDLISTATNSSDHNNPQSRGGFIGSGRGEGTQTSFVYPGKTLLQLFSI